MPFFRCKCSERSIPTCVGLIPTADANPLVASQPASGVAPAGTGAFTVPAPNGGTGMMFNSVQPAQVTAAPAAPMTGTTAPAATPQMNIPTVPPMANPTAATTATAAPNAAPAAPVGAPSTISL